MSIQVQKFAINKIIRTFVDTHADIRNTCIVLLFTILVHLVSVLYMLDRKQIISAPFLLHIYLFRGDGLKQLHWLGQLDYDFIDWELHVEIGVERRHLVIVMPHSVAGSYRPPVEYERVIFRRGGAILCQLFWSWFGF